MSKRILAGALSLTLGLALLFTFGCAGRSRSARFYVLSPISAPAAEANDISGVRRDIAIGISAVSLPKYLRKQQIVTRTGSNELHLAEYDRWGGKIEEDIGRGIAENLSIILNTDKVLSYSSVEPAALDYTIKADIIRFEGSLGGDLDFFVRWSVFDNQDKSVYGIQATLIREPTGGSTYADMVAAQSRALAVFSHELAEIIKKLSGS